MYLAEAHGFDAAGWIAARGGPETVTPYQVALLLTDSPASQWDSIAASLIAANVPSSVISTGRGFANQVGMSPDWRVKAKWAGIGALAGYVLCALGNRR